MPKLVRVGLVSVDGARPNQGTSFYCSTNSLRTERFGIAPESNLPRFTAFAAAYRKPKSPVFENKRRYCGPTAT